MSKKVIFIICCVTLIIILIFLYCSKPKNANMSIDELVYYFEKQGYTFEYYTYKDSYNNTPIEFSLETLTNNYYVITKNFDTEFSSIAFQNKSLNNNYYYIKLDNGDNSPQTQGEKNQKYNFDEFLKVHQITEKQLIKLINYCFETQYNTKKD